MHNYTIYLNKDQRCDNEDCHSCCYEDILADYYTFEGIWICFYKNEKVDPAIPEIITPAVCVLRIRESIVEAIAIEEDERG